MFLNRSIQYDLNNLGRGSPFVPNYFKITPVVFDKKIFKFFPYNTKEKLARRPGSHGFGRINVIRLFAPNYYQIFPVGFDKKIFIEKNWLGPTVGHFFQWINIISTTFVEGHQRTIDAKLFSNQLRDF